MVPGRQALVVSLARHVLIGDGGHGDEVDVFLFEALLEQVWPNDFSELVEALL